VKRFGLDSNGPTEVLGSYAPHVSTLLVLSYLIRNFNELQICVETKSYLSVSVKVDI
jgi:hypothetical protein